MEWSDGSLIAEVPGKPLGWFHLAIIFHGATNGLSVYYDGKLKNRRTTELRPSIPRSSSSGKMVIGRLSYNYDGNYASVMMDELAIWNN